LRLRGLREELKHVDADIKKMVPELEKKSKAVKAAEAKLEKLQATIDEADDTVFAAFCRKIKVASIRDYEDVQLKAAREESEAMEAFSAQKARVTHQ
jgi:structural maintenance of chromosome 1